MKLLNSEKLNMKIPKYEKVINAFIPSKIYIPLYDSSLGIKIGGKIILEDNSRYIILDILKMPCQSLD